MKIVATIEARMNSSRLPGKVLLPVQERPILGILIERLRKVKLINEIVVATTSSKSDDIIVDFCKENNVKVFRGSEEDVMGRVIGAAESVLGDVIVEITGDCPLIDPSIVEQFITIFLANKAEYVSNSIVRSYPDGMDVQVFSLEILKKSYKLTNEKLDREHVTLHIRNNPNLFSHLNIIAPPEIYYPELGLTLDEKDDYILISKIFENLYSSDKFFSCHEIVKYLEKNKDLYLINKHVKRKNNT